MSRIACRVVLVGLISAVAGGCYEVAFPLDVSPRTPLDQKLLSTWRCVTPSMDTEALTLVIGRAREGVYAVSVQEPGDPPDRYEAHGSEVAGETLLNVKDLKDAGGVSPKPWVFVRYFLLKPDILHVQVVSDKALDGVEASPAAVRQAVERRRKDPALFADVFTCVRAKAAE
jgi:hypothetical protein